MKGEFYTILNMNIVIFVKIIILKEMKTINAINVNFVIQNHQKTISSVIFVKSVMRVIKKNTFFVKNVRDVIKID